MLFDKYKDVAESLLKFISIIIGLFFIAGVLIQSIATDSIGIHEESFIQIRSVLIGATFFFYTFLFYILVLCLWYSLFLIIFPVTKKKYWRLLKLYKLLFWIIIVNGLGNIIGYMFPWGYSWEALYSKMFEWDVYLSSYNNFTSSFLSPKLITLYFVLSVNFLLLYFLRDIPDNEPEDKIFFRVLWKINPESSGFILALMILVSIPFVLINYAVEIYPNIRSNIGGGQPSIVRILTVESDSSKLSQSVLSKKVLWKVDEKFTYFTPLTDSLDRRTNVVAIKTDDIKEIRYYKGYVKIRAGNQITMFKTE